MNDDNLLVEDSTLYPGIPIDSVVVSPLTKEVFLVSDEKKIMREVDASKVDRPVLGIFADSDYGYFTPDDAVIIKSLRDLDASGESITEALTTLASEDVNVAEKLEDIRIVKDANGTLFYEMNVYNGINVNSLYYESMEEVKAVTDYNSLIAINSNAFESISKMTPYLVVGVVLLVIFIWLFMVKKRSCK